MAQRAFLFDLDGVLIDSEPVWEKYERKAWLHLFGVDIAEKMPTLVGAGLQGVFRAATELGAVYEEGEITSAYEDIARQVYAESPITEGSEQLIDEVTSWHFKIGIVTQSPHSWIQNIVPQIPFRAKIDLVISVPDHPHLKLKPEPDGFLQAFNILDAAPKDSIVLEDSNIGIEAGKASGAYTIGYRGNLLPGYEQTGADAYADSMEDVIKLVEQFTQP